MAPRKGKWKKSKDVDQYLRELEEVYGMRIEMSIIPEVGPGEVFAAKCVLEGYWAGDGVPDGPVVYHATRIVTWPTERYISTMTRALTDLTYQCIEAYVGAIPQATPGSGPAS